MNDYRTLVILCIILLAAGSIAPAVSARFTTPEGENAGIEIGDTVFLGERNVNFSAFADQSQGDLKQMVRINEAGEPTDPIMISNSIATSIPRGIKTNVRYYPIYSDGTGVFTAPDRSKPCWVQDVAVYLGEMKIQVYDTDVRPKPSPARPDAIPYTMGVQFLLPENTLPVGEFNGAWYEYELRGNVRTSEIKNLQGDEISLKRLTANPATEDRRFAFRFSDQDAVGRGNRATMTFRMTLNGLDYERSWTFDVKDYSLDLGLSENSVQQGKTITLNLHGVPFTQYTVSLDEGSEYPLFSGGGWDTKISDYQVIAHPDWDGTVDLSIEVPRSAPLTSYTVQAKDPDSTDQPVSATFYVVTDPKAETELVFEEPGKSGFMYALGDVIRLRGWCKNVNERIPVYLYVTGPNLPANGAPLTDPTEEVVDGDPATFTVTTYDPFFNRWEYYWWTSYYARAGCVADTYTVHASLKPIGYLKSAPDGAGSFDGEAPPAWDIPLNEPTLQAKFDERSGSSFAQGDRLYCWWYARGSPGLTGPMSSQGHIKWYIFGNNFRYADFDSHFPIYPDISESGEQSGVGDTSTPDGVYGFNYGRDFTYKLAPGEYYIVYQHPGRDNRFSILPENDPFFKGQVSKVVGQEGGITTVRLDSLDARAAAAALTAALDSPYVDDIYVMDTFTIEKPSITIRAPGTVTVGEKLTVKGTTNLASQNKGADKVEVGDELALTIARLDLDNGQKGNTATKFQTLYAKPESLDPATGERSFSFDAVETGSWYPGQYLITVECRDARYKNTASFELVGEGVRRETTEVAPSTDPALSDRGTTIPCETEEWATPPPRTTIPLTTPQQSGGAMPLAALASLLAALELFRRR
jgi:hypothetical protein